MFGFCSLTIKARKEAASARPAIFRISIAALPFRSIEIKRRILFFERDRPQ